MQCSEKNLNKNLRGGKTVAGLTNINVSNVCYFVNLFENNVLSYVLRSFISLRSFLNKETKLLNPVWKISKVH